MGFYTDKQKEITPIPRTKYHYIVQDITHIN